MRKGKTVIEQFLAPFFTLSTLGYQTGSRIDGLFGTRTEEALRGYQRRTSLTVDGVCGCSSWKKITTAVIGIGRTKTTID